MQECSFSVDIVSQFALEHPGKRQADILTNSFKGLEMWQALENQDNFATILSLFVQIEPESDHFIKKALHEKKLSLLLMGTSDLGEL